MKRHGYTIIELIISVGLLTGAISIALFATIGSSGLVQKADSRAAVTESGRAVSDTFRRVAGNASMSSVYLTDETGTDQEVNTAVWVKSFSKEQSESVCHVIGRALPHPTLSGKFILSNAGNSVAYWIAKMDTNQNCVIAADLTTQALYQNRLTSESTYVVEFSAALTYNDSARLIYPLLRYKLDIGLATKQGTLVGSSQTTPIVLASAVPVGLINASIGPLTIDTTALPDGNCGASYSASLQATGGSPNYTWQAISGLPSGLAVSQSGEVTGIHNCSVTSNYEIVVRVTDSENTTTTKTVTLKVIVAQGQLTILSNSPLPQASKLTTYPSYTFTAQGADSFVWSLIGGPPTSAIGSTTGVFTFFPQAPVVNPGTYNFQVKVIDALDSSRSVTKDFTIVVVSGGPV